MSTVHRSCEWCKKPFTARVADVNRGWAKYCSKRCKAIEQESRTGQHAKHVALPKSVPRIRTNVPVGGWQWRDKDGQFHYPANMPTRHLFYTLRMIWNNFMPSEARVGSVNLYEFGRFYSRAYLADSIYRIAEELAKRDDMNADWSAQLAAMRRWFDSPLLKLAGPVEPEKPTSPTRKMSDPESRFPAGMQEWERRELRHEEDLYESTTSHGQDGTGGC